MKINKSDYIKDTLSYIQSKINEDNKLQHYDINHDAEDIFMHILNFLYGWNLQNANDEIINFPAIDLIDTTNKIAIQVTSSTSKKKVKTDTIDAFEKLVKEDKYQVFADYKIKMFYIKNKPSNTTLKNWEDEGLISQSNILGIEDINRKISVDTDTLTTKVFRYLCNKFHDKACESSTLNRSLTTKTSTHDSSFVGRENELKAIDTMLDNSNSLLLINGIGGIGKSSLANHYLYTREQQFKHYGFIDGLGSFISEFKNSLELKAEKEEELYSEIISKLKNLKYKKLLVIDNVEDIEANKKLIEMILSLEKYDYKILFTSRKKIKKVKSYPLGTLLPLDAQKLFLSYCKSDELDKVDRIINYFGLHTLFIKLVAETIENEGYGLDDILEKFEKGELSKIEFTDNESGEDVTFNKNLQELFSMQNLNDEYVLLLKRLSVLPSIDIKLSFLEEILGKERLKGRLNFLVGSGWLIKNDDSYKLHQIIREFILSNYSPKFEEIEDIVDFFTLYADDDKIKNISYTDNYIIYFKSLVMISKKLSYKNEKIIYSFIGLGLSYIQLSIYEKSVRVFNEAMVLNKKLNENNNSVKGSLYSGLALLYRKIDKYELSLSFSKKSFKISINMHGLSNIETVATLNNLALIYETIGKYEKALPLYFKALMISEKYDKCTEAIAMIETNLSQLYKEKGEYDKALKYAEKSVKICEELYTSLHSSTAVVYNNKAEIYRVLSQYDKAMPLYQKSLEINKLIFGFLHTETATNYNNIAMIHEANEEYTEALNFYKKALEIREKLLGPNHVVTGTSYHNIGMLYVSLKRYDEALSLVKKDLNISERSLGRYHIDTLTSYHSLGIIYFKLEHFEKSSNFLKEAITIANKLSLLNHPLVKYTKEVLDYVEKQLKIPVQMSTKIQKVGRNCMCPCQSGKKYKRCCGKKK